jgi:hypothetical protein
LCSPFISTYYSSNSGNKISHTNGEQKSPIDRSKKYIEEVIAARSRNPEKCPFLGKWIKLKIHRVRPVAIAAAKICLA